jgi:hypothetical protein
MIKNVYGSGRYIVTTHNGASNFMNNYSGAQGLGNIRFNTTSQSLEVYDGTMWHPVQMDTVNLSLTSDAQDAIAWADQKRHEEIRIQTLAERHPAVADLMAAVRDAEEKLRIAVALVQV